jgi:hypothetical protein
MQAGAFLCSMGVKNWWTSTTWICVDEREKNCDTFKRRVPLGERLPGDGFAREYGVPGFTDAVEPILHGYGGDGYGRATHGITRGVCGACEGLPLVCLQRLSW